MFEEKCVILKEVKTIAVVGISRNRFAISREIAEYLSRNSYEVVGVNPNNSFTDADGIKVYNNLVEIPHKIDLVNVFRKSQDIPDIINDVIQISPNVLWLQLGIKNDKCAQLASENGIRVIQNSCIKIDHNYCLSFN